MTWFKVDDKFPSHRKVLSIPRGARRLQAVGAWTLAGAWISGNTHDGSIPSYVLDDLGITAKAVADLVASGLWHELTGGFDVHDYEDYNPNKEQVDAKREAAAERQRKAREKATASRRDKDVTHTVTPENVTDTVTLPPTRPDPTPKEQTPSVSSPRKRGTTAPDLFPITAELAEWGRENAPLITDPRSETLRFLDHHRAKGSLFKDWTAAWRTWMRNAQTFAERDQPKPEQKRAEPAWMR